jgi:hypothetical protein
MYSEQWIEWDGDGINIGDIDAVQNVLFYHEFPIIFLTVFCLRVSRAH